MVEISSSGNIRPAPPRAQAVASLPAVGGLLLAPLPVRPPGGSQTYAAINPLRPRNSGAQ